MGKYGLKRLKKVGKSSFLVKNKDCLYINKNNLKPVSISGRILHIIVGVSIKFKNELMVNKEINLKKFKNFKYPKMVDTDNDSYMVFEYLDGIEGINTTNIYCTNLIKSLVEFQTSDYKLRHILIRKISIKILRLPLNVMRRAFTMINSTISLRIALKILKVLIKSSYYQKKLNKGFWIHNDLLPNNLITINNKTIYIIDFENTLYECKWVLTDIVDISYNIDNMQFDFELVLYYLNELKKKCIPISNIKIDIQVRLVLIRRMLQSLSSKRYSNKEKENFLDFLCNVLLNDNRYNCWFKGMVDNINE